MTSAIVDLFVNLIGNDASLIAATKRSGAALEGMVGKTSAVKEGIKKAGAASALALAAIGIYSIKAAGDFQAEMELVHTQAKYTQGDLDGLKDKVLALASETGQAPVELAKGLYHIASAGFSSSEAIDILRAAAQNASISMSNMDDSAQGIIGVLAAGLPDIKDAADAAAILNATVGIGDMRFQQLNMAIATGTLSVFKVAGLGMKDFSAALATVTDNVTPANVAATRIRMAVSMLAGPSNVSAKALEALGLTAKEAKGAFAHVEYLNKYGITMTQLSGDLRKPNGLMVALGDLKSHLEKSGLSAVEQAAVINKAFGGAKTAAGIEMLISQFPRLQSKYVALGNSTTRAKEQQESWNATQKTFRQQTHELGASLQVLAIKLGDELLPPLTKFVNFLVSHKAAMQTFFIVLLIFLGLLTIAWIAMGIAAIAASWEILLILAAVALVAYGIYELVTHWKTVWGWIKRIAMDVWNWLKSAWEATWNFMKGVGRWVMDWIVNPIVKAWDWLVNASKAAWNWIVGIIKWVFNNVFAPIMRWVNKWIITPFRVMMSIVIWIFKFVWGFVSAIAKDLAKVVYNVFIGPMISYFKFLWKIISWVWDQIVTGFKWVWSGLVALWGLIKKYVIDPMGKAIDFVKKMWDGAWKGIKAAASGVWDFLKMIWGYIKKGYEDYITKPLDGMKKLWDKLWGGIKDTVLGIWNDHIKPIFDKIKNAIDTVIKGVKSINPANAGAGLWNGIKNFFADGGRVPGPLNAPMLAVVHGGEYVVSNEMQKGRKPMTGFGTVYSGRTATYAASSGDSVEHIHVNVDGKQLFDFVVQRSQRNKKRNTSTFLT